jgi:ribosomal protein S18 acetylase RimI-like enzyme
MSGGPPSLHPIGLRPATESDIEYLYALHVATMREYVERTWGWDEAFQEARFRGNYVPAETQIITFGGRDVGMLSIEERDPDLFLRSIEIDPQYQHQGLGTAIIAKIIADGIRKKKPVFLHVLRANPAKRLYDRLGFSVVAETSTHLHMRTTLSEDGTGHG